MNCLFCYVDKTIPVVLDETFFIDSVKYLSKLTPQVALGGGEPLIYPEFLKKFSVECKKYDLICNMTTNGTLLDNLNVDEIRNLLSDFTLISVSLDHQKVDNIKPYFERHHKLRTAGIKTGANFLLEQIDDSTIELIHDLCCLVEYVYLLHPKNFALNEDILKYGDALRYLSVLHENLYVDDLMEKILSEGYEWKTPCHYGDDIISISWDGNVYGCSFSKEPLLTLYEPKDILKIKNIKYERRLQCPYLIKCS